MNKVIVFILTTIIIFLLPPRTFASSLKLIDTIESPQTLAPVSTVEKVFDWTWNGGKLSLSKNSDGTGIPKFGRDMTIWVEWPQSSSSNSVSFLRHEKMGSNIICDPSGNTPIKIYNRLDVSELSSRLLEGGKYRLHIGLAFCANTAIDDMYLYEEDPIPTKNIQGFDSYLIKKEDGRVYQSPWITYTDNLYFEKTVRAKVTSNDYITISADPEGKNPIKFDDILSILDKNGNVIASWNNGLTSDSNGYCSGIRAFSDKPLTLNVATIPKKLLENDADGNTYITLKFQLKPTCKDALWRTLEVSNIYLQVSPLPTTNTAFLDLPWKYWKDGDSDASKESKFVERVLNGPGSWFDHTYPGEEYKSFGGERTTMFTRYDSATTLPVGEQSMCFNYDGHEGTDFNQKCSYLDKIQNISAAASGTAEFHLKVPSPTPGWQPGNWVQIDHHNGYKTIYMHLADSSMVQTSGTKEVSQGDVLGRVGSTGHSTGPHLHFGVCHDKTSAGGTVIPCNFNDPQFFVDPYGWYPTDMSKPDPWPLLTWANGTKKGSESTMLWKMPDPPTSGDISQQATTVHTGNVTAQISAGTTNEYATATLKPEAAPMNIFSQAGVLLRSLTHGVDITISGKYGAITNLNKELCVTFNWGDVNEHLFDKNSMAIFSSPDRIQWTKEASTNIDYTNKTATACVKHLTHFALMAEPLSLVAPVTTAQYGGQGTYPYFRSDVTITLSAAQEKNIPIDETYVSINGGEKELYTKPLSFSKEGEYTLAFYSIDAAGNIESEKSATFTIDTTAPDGAIVYDPLQKDIVVKPQSPDVLIATSAAFTDVHQVKLTREVVGRQHGQQEENESTGGPRAIVSPPSSLFQTLSSLLKKVTPTPSPTPLHHDEDNDHMQYRYTLTDAAGNTTAFLVKTKREAERNETQVRWEGIDVEQQGSPSAEFVPFRLSIEDHSEKNQSSLKQTYELMQKGQHDWVERVRMMWDSKKNSTTLMQIVGSDKPQQSTLKGKPLLMLTVSHGIVKATW